MRLLLFNFFLSTFLFSSWVVSIAQNVDNLRSERESLLREINLTNQLVQEKKVEREKAFQQVKLLNREIFLRERVIENLRVEIESLGSSIRLNQLFIKDIEVEIANDKEKYGRLLIDTYKRRGSLDELIMLLSSESLSTAYRRFRLIKEYSRYRRSHVEALKENQAHLESQLAAVKVKIDLKAASLSQLESELHSLDRNVTSKRVLVDNLQKEEKWLLSTLKDRQTKAKLLETRILDIIRQAKASVNEASAGGDFSKFAGKLSWPVRNGIIVSHFGAHPHPVLRNVVVNNNGIDIQAIGNDHVLAVHPGEVSRVITIPGYNNAIIVRHGNFLTVYANLRVVNVKQGQSVNRGELLGSIFKENNDADGILHFEIWNENQKLDPAKWISK